MMADVFSPRFVLLYCVKYALRGAFFDRIFLK